MAHIHMSRELIASSTIDELRALTRNIAVEELPQIIPLLEADTRRGTTTLALTLTRRWQAQATLEHEFRTRWVHEDRKRQLGYQLVAGVDEAGRGPLAGPVVAAAVILPRTIYLPTLNDSKQLTAEEREELELRIRTEACAFSVAEVGVDYIDEHNIREAAHEAMRRALRGLSPGPDYVLVDGDACPAGIDLPQESIIGGDALSNSIAAASVLAKVHRDRLMVAYHEQYPAYGFANHKGYATPEHLSAVRRHGRCPIHRLSFRHVITRKELGSWGEEQASRHLRSRGMQVVDRNVTCAGAELDLICRDGPVLTFVEVRTGRPGTPPGQLLASIDLEKQARILRAARGYAAEIGHDGPVRFDAVAVRVQTFASDQGKRWVPHITHVPGAFGSAHYGAGSIE